ncbi:hypothetical protein DPMN_051834 [Dreissena polymorpha]|uniref:Uncharacterized protein n=1 Tax=Dreissena polymorpha TaxID=45954 RepID=A0A9D4HNQ6_DREPO|nr:hypothetical protein DPMN_051834 [Dreissena polymorpha]
MSSCADVFIELLSTKNGAVGAVECLSSDDMTVGVNSGAKQSCFWSYSTSLEGVLADSDEDESRRGTLLRKFHMQKLNRISTAETEFIKSKIRVTGLHMEEDFHVCYSILQKQDALFQLMSRWQAVQTCFLELPNRSCGVLVVSDEDDSRRGTLLRSEWDLQTGNGLIAVPTVNKDFNCCETTQQKIQVPGVDREMCLKKEFYYCDSTLQKQGLSRSDGKEEDFKKEIQQLCLDSSHETYIAVTVPQWCGCVAYCWADLPETSVLYYLTSQLYYQASSDNKAPLWKQHNKKLYCKTSSDSKAPEHATQNKKCQFANLDVDTE